MSIPTAAEFYKYTTHIDGIDNYMIEFAKMHVAEALRKASEYAEITDNGRFPFIDKSSILESYPLKNIK